MASRVVQSFEGFHRKPGERDMANRWQMTSRPQWPVVAGRTSEVVTEWRQQEARETLREIARHEGLDWLVREVLSMLPGRR